MTNSKTEPILLARHNANNARAKREKADEQFQKAKERVEHLEYYQERIRPSFHEGALVSVKGGEWRDCPGKIKEIHGRKISVSLDLDGYSTKTFRRDELELIAKPCSKDWEWLRPSWKDVFLEERRQLKEHQQFAEADHEDDMVLKQILRDHHKRPRREASRSRDEGTPSRS